ncbi:MAG: protein kinase [Acidobacteria bacterium]|nr:protein kinase [Acidobacteriota bacterium]
MAYCPECGSKVADIDVFCPYCGISLQPIAVEKNNSGSPITPAGTERPETKNRTADEIPAAATQEEYKMAESSTQAKDKSLVKKKTEDYLPISTVENVEYPTESVEIPAQDFESEISADSASVGESEILPPDFEKTLEKEPPPNIDIEPIEPIVETASDNQETELPSIIGTEGKSVAADILPIETENSISDVGGNLKDSSVVKIAERFDVETDSPPKPNEESEIKENLIVEESENSSEITISELDEIDFIATIPYMPGKSAKGKIAKNNSESSESNKEKLEPPALNENADVAENPIAKPNVELPENQFPPPRFDSVRIMESEEAPVKVAKSKSKQAAAKSVEESPTEDAAQNQSDEKESRSNTKPNIGVGDTDGKGRSKLKPLDEGTILNERYEIVRKIGGGGMGAVYLASDKNLGGVLRAVKEMVQSYIEEQQQDKAVNDFKRESLLLTSLEHQSIPTIYDYFFDEKEARFYLVMKYITGGDLASQLRSANEGRINEKDVTKWAIQIADVLDYLHNRQPPIVYRDLKPANIMIDGNTGRAMLIDFGIARWINKEEKGVTAVGTMGYAPPELFSGNVEPRSDIYSLGSTMFHLLTGADPQSNPLLIFDFQKHPRPRQINPQLSDQMEKILMRSVEYNAEMRFDSAAEMRQALEDHLANLDTHKVTFGVKENPIPVGLSEQLVFCGFCGQKIFATDMFCAFCGAKQPLSQRGVSSENYAPQPVTAQLLIIGTNELETPAYRIEKDENLIGRRDPMSNIFPEVDLSRYDPQTKISRRHARIHRSGNQFMIEDLGSSNGTIVLPVVNETMRLLPHKPYTLTNGDKLKLGDTTLHFIIG